MDSTEVIADGSQAAAALQASRVRGADKRRLVRAAPAKVPARRVCRVSQPVQHADMAAPPGGASAGGAMVPRVCSGGDPDASHRRGSHPTASRRLAALYRQEQPPEPLQVPSRPEDSAGTTGRLDPDFIRLNAKNRYVACASACARIPPRTRARTKVGPHPRGQIVLSSTPLYTVAE